MKNLLPFLISLFLMTIFINCASQSKIRQFDIPTINRLGSEIYIRDALAANATDILYAQDLNFDTIPLKGWIVDQEQDKYIVHFIKEEEGSYLKAIDIVYDTGQIGEVVFPDSENLSEDQLARFRARQLALRNISEPCSKTYNTVVLPDIDGSGYIVYALAATTEPDIVFIGGHYRFTISEDGTIIEQQDRLSKTCATLSTKIDPGESIEAYAVTNIISNTPLETHVFLSLAYARPFLVITKDYIWMVDGGVSEDAKKRDRDFKTWHGNLYFQQTSLYAREMSFGIQLIEYFSLARYCRALCR